MSLAELNNDDFEKSPKNVRKADSGKCLENSFEIHETTNDKMVEGVVQVLEDGETLSIFRHCWNKSNTTGKYYDVTKDYIWLTPKHKACLASKGHKGEITYRYFSGYEYDKPNLYNTDKEIELGFYFNFDDEIKRLWQGQNSTENRK